MNAPERQLFFTRILLVVWAMFTLTLLCSVALLGYEITRLGGSPFEVPAGPAEPPAPSQPPESAGATVEIKLYFTAADGRLLVPERRRMALSDFTVENCREALDALVRGPRDLLTPILPESVKLRALYMIEGGELVIDFSRELVLDHKKSASAEALMVYGIVNTLTQRTLAGRRDGAAQKVRFLVEGAPPGEAFPSHIDLREPVSPDPRWILTWENPGAAHG